MSEKLSTLAYKAIKTDIVHCVLLPGQQISQPQLMERYQYGLVPIREALQRLAQEELVKAIPRTGYIVQPITLSDIHEIYELRLPLEISAARFCAQRASEEKLNSILAQADFKYDFHDPNSYEIFLKNNAAFHIEIAAAGGNRRLVRLIKRLMDDLTRVLYLGLGVQDRAEEMQLEHIHLAQALLEREMGKIEALVAEQIEHSLETILESLAQPLQTNEQRRMQTYLHLTKQ